MGGESTEGLSPETIKKISLAIAAIIVLGILAIIGQVFKDKIKKFQKSQTNKVFPTPTRMPKPLAISADEALTKLNKALEKYNRNLKLQMNPGLKTKQIADISGGKHISLPKESYSLYSWHNGSRKNDDSLEWFVPLTEAISNVSQKQTAYNDAKNSGDLKDISLSQITAYQRSWLPLYKTSSRCSLNMDISRKPEEGAYFWTDPNHNPFKMPYPLLVSALNRKRLRS